MSADAFILTCAVTAFIVVMAFVGVPTWRLARSVDKLREDNQKHAEKLPSTLNAGDAVAYARRRVDQIGDHFFRAFCAMSPDERVGDNGLRVAQIYNQLHIAFDRLDVALAMAEGASAPSLADPKIQACLSRIIEGMDGLDEPPEAAVVTFGDHPTHH